MEIIKLNKICFSCQKADLGGKLALLEEKLNAGEQYDGELLDLKEVNLLNKMCGKAAMIALGTLVNKVLEASKEGQQVEELLPEQVEMLNNICMGMKQVKLGDKMVEFIEKINQGTKPTDPVATKEELLEALAKGDNVKLMADITLQSKLEINNDAVINLNNQKIMCETANTRVIEVKNGKKLVLKDGQVAGNTSGAQPIIFVGGDADVKIENCVLTNSTGKDVIKTNGTEGNVHLVLDNCEVNGRNYLPAGGYYEFNNCEVVGSKCAIYFKTGDIKINGGMFKSDGTDGDWAHSNNGYFSTGDAVIVESCVYPGGVPHLIIEGNPEFIPGVPAEGAVYKNYGLLAIQWRQNEAADYPEINIESALPYRLGKVTGYDQESGPYYHFTDENTELIG